MIRLATWCFDSDGRLVTQAQALRNVVTEGVHAEAVGVDAFGVGEHHRADFAVSAPEVVLARHRRQDRADSSRFGGDGAQHRRSDQGVSAIFDAQRSVERARRGDSWQGVVHGVVSAVRLRSVEIQRVVRREAGAFVKLLDQQPIVYPQIENGRLRTWVGVGGSPESVVRAARHGLPLTLAIIGGSAKRFLPYVDLYQAGVEGVRKRSPQPIGVHSPGHVAETDEQARAEVCAALSRDDDSHRPRARLASTRPRRLRTRSRSGRCAVCRLARNGRGQDPPHGEGSRPLALRSQIQQRHVAARAR